MLFLLFNRTYNWRMTYPSHKRKTTWLSSHSTSRNITLKTRKSRPTLWPRRNSSFNRNTKSVRINCIRPTRALRSLRKRMRGTQQASPTWSRMRAGLLWVKTTLPLMGLSGRARSFQTKLRWPRASSTLLIPRVRKEMMAHCCQRLKGACVQACLETKWTDGGCWGEADRNQPRSKWQRSLVSNSRIWAKAAIAEMNKIESKDRKKN